MDIKIHQKSMKELIQKPSLESNWVKGPCTLYKGNCTFYCFFRVCIFFRLGALFVVFLSVFGLCRRVSTAICVSQTAHTHAHNSIAQWMPPRVLRGGRGMNVRSRGRGMRGRGMNVRSRGRGITLFGNSVPGGTRVSTARRNERGGMITVRSRCTRVRRQERTGLRSELGKHGHPTQKRRSQKYIKFPPPAKAPGSGRPSLQQLYRTLQAIGEAISVTQAIRCCHPIAKVAQL